GELVAGLDLGTTKACCVAAEVDDRNEPVIVGVGVSPSNGIRRGVVVDIEATTRAVEDAVNKASQQCGAQVLSVYVGVTGEHIQSMNSRGVTAITHPDREITETDRQRVLDQSRVIVIPPDREILHAIPRSYSIDGQEGIREPVGMCGSRLEVETHIVTGAQTFLLNVEKCVARARLGMREMVLEPLATALGVLTPAERNLGVCVLDIGGGTTDIAVLTDGEIFHAAVIPVGGNHVTNDIAQLLRVTADEAERVKVEHGSALPATVGEVESVGLTQIGRTEPRPLRRRALCDIIEARMQELFHLVKKELLRADCTERMTAGVVLTGGGSLLPGVLECASEILQGPVRLGRPSGVGGLADAAGGPEFSTAVGLVRWAVRSEDVARPAQQGGALNQITRFFSRFRPR
ncbi:MAG: cell division protein FtsA, partial [Armatimonadetes bacterium]|nr:cell division protein FtsA [Armatimonadota bacterium]